jgi:hypothetical protein
VEKLEILLIIALVLLAFLIYEYAYYKSSKFLTLKNSIQHYTQKCNELNQHIESLKNTYLNVNQINYGQATYQDNSKWNFKRPELKKRPKSQYVYNCSLSVCRNAEQQPFKYLCKYFNIKPTEETLNNFEEVFNNFSAAEQGKVLLTTERDEIISNISKDIPFLIKTFSKKKLVKNLGFDEIDLSQLYFPKYIFNYTSAGGNSSMNCEILLNVENLEQFIQYLSELVKFRKSVAGQRALMTSSLREHIKARDNYTCQKCGVSVHEEPHLLLEIDHIIPLSKGGLTTEKNLQTLCWKCNRNKGSKIE